MSRASGTEQASLSSFGTTREDASEPDGRQPHGLADPGGWTHRGRTARAEGDSRGSIQARNGLLPTVNSFSEPVAKKLKFL